MEASRVDMEVKEGSLRAKERVATIITITMVKVVREVTTSKEAVGMVSRVVVISRVVDTSVVPLVLYRVA